MESHDRRKICKLLEGCTDGIMLRVFFQVIRQILYHPLGSRIPHTHLGGPKVRLNPLIREKKMKHFLALAVVGGGRDFFYLSDKVQINSSYEI